MSAELQARKEAKDILRLTLFKRNPDGTYTTTPLPVLYAGEDQPASGEYVILSVISAPVIGDMSGYAYQRVRLQVDVWQLAISDTDVSLWGGKALRALSDAGWNAQAGTLYAPEGQKDANGRRWMRYGFDVIREYAAL